MRVLTNDGGWALTYRTVMCPRAGCYRGSYAASMSFAPERNDRTSLAALYTIMIILYGPLFYWQDLLLFMPPLTAVRLVDSFEVCAGPLLVMR